MRKPSEPRYCIEHWSKEHDATSFYSELFSIKKYIQEQANRDVSSHTSSIFVLVECGKKIVRGFYSLSSISIVFDELPTNIQKKLPRYPETSGILLGRLGVDKVSSEKETELVGAKPRLGELLLVDAQNRSLAAVKNVGSAILVIDAEIPKAEELETGARDPLSFYTQYGFVQLSKNPRRLVKTMRAIAKEFETA